jgi:hypothetical protein
MVHEIVVGVSEVGIVAPPKDLLDLVVVDFV